MSAIGYIAVCDYCGDVFEIKDRASLNIAKAMMEAIEEKIVANGDHECKCHNPTIPTFEEIEKEIEESKKHLPQAVAAGDGSIDDEQKLKNDELNTEICEKTAKNENKSSVFVNKPSSKQKQEQVNSGPESENDIVKSRLLNKVNRPEMMAIAGHDLLCYAIVDSDVVVQYAGVKSAYLTIENANRLSKLENGELKQEIIDYLGGKDAQSTKISALNQFVGYVRDGVVNLESPKVEEITQEEVKPPRKIPPTMSHDMLRRKGLL